MALNFAGRRCFRIHTVKRHQRKQSLKMASLNGQPFLAPPLQMRIIEGNRARTGACSSLAHAQALPASQVPQRFPSRRTNHRLRIRLFNLNDFLGRLQPSHRLNDPLHPFFDSFERSRVGKPQESVVPETIARNYGNMRLLQEIERQTL